jgi:hypothetical protein
MWHVWERREKCARFWWESPKERDHTEDQGDWLGEWIGFDWLRIESGGGLL